MRGRICDACKRTTVEGYTGQWKHLWVFDLDTEPGDDETALAMELCELCVREVKSLLAERGEPGPVIGG